LWFNNDDSGQLVQDDDIYGLGFSGGAVALGDVDDDGDLDLLVSGADAGGTPRLVLVPNTRNAVEDLWMETPREVGVGLADGSSLALGDVDNDGDLDLLAAGAEGGGGRRLDVWTNTAGQFSLAQSLVIETEGLNASHLRLFDADLDGDLDLIAAGNNYDGASERSRLVYAENLGPHFSTAFGTLTELGPAGRWAGLAVGDANGDGHPDVFASGYDGTDPRLFHFEWNAAAGAFVEEVQPAATFVGPVLFGDCDGDFDLDMVGLPVRHLYENLLGPANAAPGAPTGLAATPAVAGL
jgi:hypothetical protein